MVHFLSLAVSLAALKAVVRSAQSGIWHVPRNCQFLFAQTVPFVVIALASAPCCSMLSDSGHSLCGINNRQVPSDIVATVLYGSY